MVFLGQDYHVFRLYYFNYNRDMQSPTSLSTELCISLVGGYLICHLKVNNEFLHGILTEKVFMQQSPSFTNTMHPFYVCKLYKSIYSFKQLVPSVLYNELKEFLLSCGFVNSHSNTSLFVDNDQWITTYFLVYVDDLLITRNPYDPFIHFYILFL